MPNTIHLALRGLVHKIVKLYQGTFWDQASEDGVARDRTSPANSPAIPRLTSRFGSSEGPAKAEVL